MHLLSRCSKQADGTAQPLLEAVGADPAVIGKEATTRSRDLPRCAVRPRAAPETSRQLLAVINTAASLRPPDGG